MPQIKYAGYTPVVCVPTHNIVSAEYDVPITVSQEVADDLTLNGQSTSWLAVEEG